MRKAESPEEPIRVPRAEARSAQSSAADAGAAAVDAGGRAVPPAIGPALVVPLAERRLGDDAAAARSGENGTEDAEWPAHSRSTGDRARHPYAADGGVGSRDAVRDRPGDDGLPVPGLNRHAPQSDAGYDTTYLADASGDDERGRRGTGAWGISALFVVVLTMAGGAWLFGTQTGRAFWLDIRDGLPLDAGTIGLTERAQSESVPEAEGNRAEHGDVARDAAAEVAVSEGSSVTAGSGGDAIESGARSRHSAPGDISEYALDQRPQLGASSSRRPVEAAAPIASMDRRPGVTTNAGTTPVSGDALAADAARTPARIAPDPPVEDARTLVDEGLAGAFDSRPAGAGGNAEASLRPERDASLPASGQLDTGDAALGAVGPDAENAGAADDERGAVGMGPALRIASGAESTDDERPHAGADDARRSAATSAAQSPDGAATSGSTAQGPTADHLPAAAEGRRQTGAALDRAQASLAAVGIDVSPGDQGALIANLGNFVQFQTGSVEPDAKARRFIGDVASRLVPALPIAIRVVGHTDQVGGVWVNDWLSEQRAAAVAQILADNGIPAALLSHEGKGESEPLVDPGAADPTAAAVNRRIELHLTQVMPGPGQRQ